MTKGNDSVNSRVSQVPVDNDELEERSFVILRHIADDDHRRLSAVGLYSMTSRRTA